MLIIRILFVVAVCILSYTAFGQTGSITLHDEKFSFTPHEFYLADVADERTERNYVALLINNKDIKHSPIKVDLKNGTVISVKNFLYRNLYRDTSLRPVMATIKEFKLVETALPNGHVSGHLAVAFSFALQLSYSTVHLIDYNGGIRYTRPCSRPIDPEAILRHGIEDALAYFNTWIDSEANSNALLAKSVKIKFTDYYEKQEGDTIYYSINRPLT